MGKKGKGASNNLGKALIRDRFGSKKLKKNGNQPSMLHTTEINDGYDWGRLNLRSVTEESSVQEFFSTAELAGTEFTAEKLNIKFVNSINNGLLSKDEKKKLLETQEEYKDFVKIPRRPKWDSSTSSHELDTREKEAFLEWRRNLAMLQEMKELILTPYERNLEFWRQLWRVVERSDVIVQIVDARNPLLFRCQDLERYVKEVDSNKLNMILLNKADFLTDEQRRAWAKYFTDINIQVAFFSATLAKEQKIEEEKESEASSINKNNNSDDDNGDDNSDKEDDSSVKEFRKYSDFASSSEYKNLTDDDVIAHNDDVCTALNAETEQDTQIECAIKNLSMSESDSKHEKKKIINSPKLLNRDDLITFFKTMYNGNKTYTDGVTTIGLVGYPNVGKSSTINALFMTKKVSVSATPGKTKHFQTLYLDKDLVLCDCPGLVMPSFVNTKSEMILNGILPIDQMRDHVPAISLLVTLIPRHVLEDLYGIMLPVPSEEEDPDRPPTTEEFLNVHAYNRGFMTQNGQPDNSRSARYVLKDFVNGKLLHCVAPPTLEQHRYHTFLPRHRNISANKHIPARVVRLNQGYCVTAEQLNCKFFQDIHVKGPLQHSSSTTMGSTTSLMESIDGQCKKPWKVRNKHINKNKREKARRKYAHLDQH